MVGCSPSEGAQARQWKTLAAAARAARLTAATVASTFRPDGVEGVGDSLDSSSALDFFFFFFFFLKPEQ